MIEHMTASDSSKPRRAADATQSDPISTRLQWALARLDLAPSALSKRAGLAPVHVAKLLKGGASHAELETLRKVALAGGINLAWLVSGKGSAFEGDAAAPEGPVARNGDLPGFAEALADAKLLRPQYAGHPVWTEIEEGDVMFDGAPTSAGVAELADWIFRHKTRPRG